MEANQHPKDELTILTQAFPFLSRDFIQTLITESEIITLEPDTEILRAGQYVKVIPLVIDGIIKVFTNKVDKDLLLYYIEPQESCIMSFTASLKNEPSKVYAITETPTTVLLIPVDKVALWRKEHPAFNAIFFQQYDQRYSDLLNTINQMLFDKLDQRLLHYLEKKRDLINDSILKIAHKEIAHDLGTSREVISRIIKKLEREQILIQHKNFIEML